MKRYNKIIFVCDSGTARAPMAEAIMKEYIIKYPVEIESRGLVVLFPEPLNQKTEAVLIYSRSTWSLPWSLLRNRRFWRNIKTA